MTADKLFQATDQQPESLHWYDVGDQIRHAGGGACGKVISRTALTAEVKWPTGTIQLIAQFDPKYVVVSRHTKEDA